ncbi:MAG: endonuclease/exonuclease/phosphatase family protein [Pseudorhodoplanes sp.]|uniref:endonuclease/exonuclease/phosphatase family protein n=1 Tax=Pseudorhodoplanes sp. TaxID=1934341 RepID=UPI003D1231ED
MSAERRRAIRVMTWNIHGALGRNPRFDLQKVVALILRADPDIVALQEVDSRRQAGLDPFVLLQESLGHYGIGAKSIITADGAYGQMLMSRWPLRDSETRDISYGAFEPRRAIRACIETPQGALHVAATHLGLSIRERKSQARVLLEMIGNRTPFVLLGDFNDWFWPGSVRRILARVLPDRSRHRTFPSGCPILRFDRIYCRPRGVLVQTWTDGEARRISDHLPCIGDVMLEGEHEGRAATDNIISPPIAVP